MTVDPISPLADALASMGPNLERHFVWAVRAILETDVKVTEPFHATAAAPTGSKFYCLIPNSNPEYHAQLALGVSDDDIAALFPGEVDPKLRNDALGEMANVIAGLVMADDHFLERFGHLKPSTPFFSEGAYTARKDPGIEGKVEAGGREILFHLSIRSQEKGQPTL
jgi:hypothetical protein